MRFDNFQPVSIHCNPLTAANDKAQCQRHIHDKRSSNNKDKPPSHWTYGAERCMRMYLPTNNNVSASPLLNLNIFLLMIPSLQTNIIEVVLEICAREYKCRTRSQK